MIQARLSIFILTAAVFCAIAVSGQIGSNSDSRGKSMQKLEFEAPRFEFKSLDEMNIINYSGDSTRQVRAWQEDIELQADVAVYNSKLAEARFHGGALFSDSLRNLAADTLIYYTGNREALAVGNVIVTEKDRLFRAGKVRYRKALRLMEAFGSVYMHDDSVRSTVTGAEAVFNDSTGYGVVTGFPVLTREDEIGSIIVITCNDTLEIDKEQKIVRLWKNVVMTKDSLTVSSEQAVYDDKTETVILTGMPVSRLVTYHAPDNAASELKMVSTVTGDSMRVFLSNRKVTGVEVIGAAHSTTVSRDTTGAVYDRSIIDSTVMRLKMNDDQVALVTAEGTARSYYHRAVLENKDGMFVNEASGDTIYFFFEEGTISQMRITGFAGTGARGKYYGFEPAPESAEEDSVEMNE